MTSHEPTSQSDESPKVGCLVMMDPRYARNSGFGLNYAAPINSSPYFDGDDVGRFKSSDIALVLDESRSDDDEWGVGWSVKVLTCAGTCGWIWANAIIVIM